MLCQSCSGTGRQIGLRNVPMRCGACKGEGVRAVRCAILGLVGVAGIEDAAVRQVVPTWTPGGFLAEYDPALGLASLKVTTDPARARRFDTAGEALKLWRARHPGIPTRPDGEPNRPLTAFHVEIVPAPPVVASSAGGGS